MSKYDVRVYIPKEIYDKLEYIATLQNMSVSRLLGQIIKEQNTAQLINVLYDTLKLIQGANNEVKKMGDSSQ